MYLSACKSIVVAIGFVLLSTLLSNSVFPSFAQTDNPSYDEGLARMSHRDFDGAILSFNSCIGANGKNAQAYFKRAQCFYYLKSLKMAIDDLNEAISCDPKKSDFYLWRGATEAKLGDDSHSIMDYEQALRLDPDLLKAAQANKDKPLAGDKSVSDSQVNGAGKKSSNPSSVANYMEALRIVSANLTAAFAPGTIFSGIIRPEFPSDQQSAFLCPDGLEKIVAEPKVVLEAARQQLDKIPTDPNAHFRAALALQQMGKTQKALDEFADAISQQPSSSQYFLARAFLHHKLADDASANIDIARARVIDPEVPTVLNFSGK